MAWDEVLTALVVLGLAVYAVMAASRRRGRPLAWYLFGLVFGASLGIIVIGWPAGLPIGLGAVGIGPDAVAFVRAKLRSGETTGSLRIRPGIVKKRDRNG